MPSPDEATLLQAWQAGDRQAGAAMVERHFAALYRFFRSKVSGDVDDLVQQTLVSCLEARGSFRGACSFRTLLFRIARRRLYDHYRSRQRLRALDFTTTSVRALGTSPSAALVRGNEVSMLREALQELPVDAQTLLELHYWEGLSTAELAQVFDVSEGTIKSRQFSARARLRELLAARGLTPDALPLTLLATPSCTAARSGSEHAHPALGLRDPLRGEPF
ncbi:MAG TPA: sigma-70 family RNA polymerase sigma factor [Polyangiales bacterium]